GAMEAPRSLIAARTAGHGGAAQHRDLPDPAAAALALYRPDVCGQRDRISGESALPPRGGRSQRIREDRALLPHLPGHRLYCLDPGIRPGASWARSWRRLLAAGADMAAAFYIPPAVLGGVVQDAQARHRRAAVLLGQAGANGGTLSAAWH